MKQTIHLLFIVMLLFSCQENNQAPKTTSSINSDTIIEQKSVTNEAGDWAYYDYDTLLSGGYNLTYQVRETETEGKLQSLTLRKGSKEIKKLNETSFPMLSKNLGYIEADFDNSFVFVQSFGSGNPHYIQLINKEDGREIKKGTWVDADEKEQVLLYIEQENKANEQLILLDIKHNKAQRISDFQNLKCSPLRDCIEIVTISPKEIVIKTSTKQDNITKKYNR